MSLCSKLDFSASAVLRNEPIPITAQTVKMFSTQLPELLTEYVRFFNTFVGRRTAFYLPATINQFNPFKGPQSGERQTNSYEDLRCRYPLKLLRRKKHRLFRSLFSSISKGGASSYRRLRFVSRGISGIYLKSSFFQRYKRQKTELPIVFANLQKRSKKNAGLYNNLVDVVAKLGLFRSLLKQLSKFHLKYFMLKNLCFKETAEHEPLVTFLVKRLKILSSQIFKIYRLELAVSEA